MELLPEDLYEVIFKFLSLKEKIKLRLVSSHFKGHIKNVHFITHKLDNIIRVSHNRELKLMNELMLLSNNIFVSYKDSQLSNVHPYFRRHHEYNTCVNGMCREKRLGYIYIKLLKPNSGTISFDGVWHLYIKRKVPYCIGCFKYNYLY